MNTNLTRRAVLKRGLAGILAYGVAPNFFPASLFGKSAPSNRLTIGLVGNGLICSAHLGTLLDLTDDCRIIATCDVMRSKAEKVRDRIETAYGKAKDSGSKASGVDIYSIHEELIARDDIDIVFVCTPDHWHAAVSAAAMRAGKDVYCEPFGNKQCDSIAKRKPRCLSESTRKKPSCRLRSARR